MVPKLDEVEARRRAPLPGEKARRGWASPYTAHEFESMEVLRRILGLRAAKEARDWLAGDRGGEARRLLGFDKPRRRHGGRDQQLMLGVPCDSVLSTYRTKHFPEAERTAVWRELEAALRDEGLQYPGAAKECDLLTADGSKLETHYTTAKYKKDEKTGERTCVNADKVTSDGGYIPPKANNADHSGSGWNLVFTASGAGRPLVWDLEDINTSESKTLVKQADELRDVLTRLPGDRLRVLSTDAAFHSQELRRTTADMGIVTNIHLASHGGPGGSNHAKARNAMRFAIDGYPNWQANGHRELICNCGQGRTFRRGKLVTGGEEPNSLGQTVTRIEGACDTCGTISITAGKWRVAQNPDRFTRCQKGEQDRADWTFGNPLTFNDNLASEYGVKRWATHEGVNGSQLTQRFPLLKGKRWFRRRAQAETEVAMVFSIIHVLAIEGAKRRQAAQTSGGRPSSGAPPGMPATPGALPLAA